jgi:hypothetical protein
MNRTGARMTKAEAFLEELYQRCLDAQVAITMSEYQAAWSEADLARNRRLRREAAVAKKAAGTA